MPIERKKKTVYAHDDVVESEPMEDATAEATEEAVETPGETATLSLSILGGQTVSAGDVVRLEVVESDADSGTVTVKYKNPKKEGVSGASAKFESMDKNNQGAM